MKLRLLLATSLLVVLLAAGFSLLTAAFGAPVAALVFTSLLVAPLGLRGNLHTYGPTLTSAQVLMDVLQSFRKQFPALNRMGTDFRGSPLKLNQQYIAHIPGLPTASTYDASTGYANGATAARGLLADIPVTVDQHPTCPLKWLHLDQIKDVKNRYEEVIANSGYVLAKGMVDSVLADATTRNFSRERIITTADFDYDALMLITGDANSQGMMNNGRVLIVNTAVANILFADPRIISKDYSGQIVTSEGYRRAINIGGFAEIREYPDLPSNNGSSLTGCTGEADDDLITKAAHGLETGDPVTFVSGTGFTGLTAGTRYFAIKASASTFKVASSYANAVAGTGIDITVDGSSGVFQKQENLTAIAFDRRAFALLTGIPEGMSSDLADQLGIPKNMVFETVTEPESGLSMAAAKWQQGGTGDFFFCPTFVWGKGLGKQGASATAGTLTDYAALRISSGASS